VRLDRLDLVWLGLLAATGVTWLVGESGALAGGSAGPVLLIFGLALAKGSAVALDFMELRDAPPLWRRLVLGWLAVVLVLIVAAWAIAG
jgi:Prokaryotic Cytochrome C oxidase subunit IV